MAITQATLRNNTLNLINQYQSTPIGQMVVSAGSSTAVANYDTNSVINSLQNEAMDIIARTCWIINANGTLASPVQGVTNILFNALTGTGYGNLWTAITVKYGSVFLQRVSKKYLDTANQYSTVSGTPQFWCPLGGQGIAVNPAFPGNASAIVINGLALPAIPANDSDPITWLDDDLSKYISYYSAALLGLKQMEDDSLFPRYAEWIREFDSGRQGMLDRMNMTDPVTTQAFYGSKITPTVFEAGGN